MNKIILYTGLLTVAAVCTAFTQETTAPAADQANQTNEQAKAQTFSPSFFRLATTDAEVEKNDYGVIKQIISDVENMYLKNILTVMEETKKSVTEKNKTRGDMYEFLSSKNFYYDSVAVARDNRHLYNGINYLKLALEKFIAIRDALEANGFEAKELNEIEYKLKKYNGIFNMFRGEDSNLHIAVRDFEYIIEKAEKGAALIDNKNEMIEIHTFLAGCHNELFKKNRGNTVLARKHLQQELFHLRKLVLLKNEGNEKLTEYKLLNLVKEYYDIIDVKSAEYNDLYRTYLEKLGKEYTDIKKRVDETGKDEGSAKTSEGTKPAGETKPAE